MPKALIIGVAAQDGSYLAEHLLSHHYTVIGTTRPGGGDDLDNIAHFAQKITSEPADLTDAASLDRIVAKHQPDEIYNLAAFSVPSASWDKAPLVGQVTGLGPLLVLEAIRKHSPSSRFFQASTREIFGHVTTPSADETTPIHPDNPYSIAKTYAHFMVQTYRRVHHLFAVNGILFTHDSPRRPLHFVTRKVTAAAACIKNHVSDIPKDAFGEPLLGSDGKLHLWDLASPRDRGYAADYVQAMHAMLQAPTPQDYVIASRSTVTVADICAAAFSHVGLNWSDHVVVDSLSRPPSTDSVTGDFSRIEADLGWRPTTPFADVVRLMVDSDLKQFT